MNSILMLKTWINGGFAYYFVKILGGFSQRIPLTTNDMIPQPNKIAITFPKKGVANRVKIQRAAIIIKKKVVKYEV